jgi:TRAP-type C4-dicarboxylate transport system permease small subunit
VRRLAAAVDRLSDAAAALAAVATLALTLMVTAGVAARRVFNAPFLFVEELSGYVVLGIVFLGLAATLKAGGHIRVDIVLGRTAGGVRTALQVGCLLAAAVWAGFVVAGAVRLLDEYWTQGVRSFAYLQTPLWIPAAVMLAGAVLLLLQILALLTRPRDAP